MGKHHPEDHSPAGPHPASIGIPAPGGFNPEAFEQAIGDLLAACGVSTESPHMGRTQARVRQFWQERLLSGYAEDPSEVLGSGFADEAEDLVVLRGIAVHGICPHHLVPFRGVAHVGYLPGGRLHGFGRIARLVDSIAHRLTYQEWLTRDVADALVTHGQARGAACVIEAEQLCLLLGENRRGDERVVTHAWAGAFTEDRELQAQFLQSAVG